MKDKFLKIFLIITLIFITLSKIFPIEKKNFKVLVVMSYENTYPWVNDVKEGIENILKNNYEIKYFYMDTKGYVAEGEQKAKEAYDLYVDFKPDGVIASDDYAQIMFVLPYLKDKVKTPVIFCGVNAEPEEYGYPASNVTGILERHHVKESIQLAQQLVPSIKNLGFLEKKDPSGDALVKQIKNEMNTYPAKFVSIKLVETLAETLKIIIKDFKECDAIYVPTLTGIIDFEGNPMSEKEAISTITKAFKKPIIGGNAFNIQYGMLSVVAKAGQEQGSVAAEMLLKAMRGTPINNLPITKNQYGQRIINVDTLKRFGITPKSSTIRSATLVNNEN